MPYLGVPYRLAYEARSYRTGLTNVVALVYRPDGNIQGPFVLVEGTGVFLGVYSYNLSTSVNDPEGEYLVAYVSPTENIRAMARFTRELRPSGSTGLVVLPSPVAVVGIVSESPTVQAQVSEVGISAVVDDTVVEGVVSESLIAAAIAEAGVSGIVNQSGSEGTVI